MADLGLFSYNFGGYDLDNMSRICVHTGTYNEIIRYGDFLTYSISWEFANISGQILLIMEDEHTNEHWREFWFWTIIAYNV